MGGWDIERGGDYEDLIRDFKGIEFKPSEHRRYWAIAAFVSGAKQELLRLIVDVQQNRNRPEGME